MPTIEVEGDLRGKNQITLPKQIVDALGVQPGDRFVFVLQDGELDVVHLYRLRESYAGCLAGVYGPPEQAHAYVRQEQEAWSE
jgi:AbrB family looped-hinge helix DNA binding protein